MQIKKTFTSNFRKCQFHVIIQTFCMSKVEMIVSMQKILYFQRRLPMTFLYISDS